MKLKDKLRLALLTAKTDRSAEENTELETLVTSAKEANLNHEDIAKEFAPDAEDDNGALTDVQLKSLIETAVRNSLPSNSADTDAIIKEIREVTSKSAQGVQLSDLEEVVKKHVGANTLDKESFLSEVKKLIPSQGVTKQELSEAFDSFAKSMRTPSKVVHDTGTSQNVSFPVEHRSGNLSVAQKQLLNLCVMHTSDQAKQETMRQNGGKSLPSHMNEGITQDQLSNAERAGDQAIKSLRNAKALGSSATGFADPNGHGLMPMNLSSDLQARMYLESILAAEMLSMEVDMPTQPFEFPLVTTRPSFYLGTEILEFGTQNSRPTESSPGTARIQLDAKKLIGMSEYSYEADEDAIIAILPMIQQQLASAAADAYEGALINGDTTGTHQDSDINGVTGHYAKLFKGFRKYALAGNCKVDLASGGISAANIIKMRKKMLRWGMKPSDLMIIVGPQGYNDLVGLDETLSFYKVGSQAQTRILTGEAPSIFGIRILVSSQVREDLNASGVYDGTTTTKGSILMIHRPSWVVGSRRGFTVEIDQSKLRQTNSVVASFRRAFTPKEQPSVAIPTVVLGYNYGV